MASPTLGSCVLLVAGALADMKRCGQELSTVARSGSISSLLAFFPCPSFLGIEPSRVDGKSDDAGSAFSADGSSMDVPDVTAGAKAIC